MLGASVRNPARDKVMRKEADIRKACSDFRDPSPSSFPASPAPVDPGNSKGGRHWRGKAEHKSRQIFVGVHA